ncbi:MAG TPA: M1 family metallopeptidase [Arachidicoccus sp.]|nr:M1 family metallopeptidase [Arachidicoccus sp.]
MHKYIVRLYRPLLLLSVTAFSFQQVSAQHYDAHQAFAPTLYTSNGNAFRSANGDPGAKYWQNQANYKLSATFDSSTHMLKGLATIDYINNSPDDLAFLWLELDQNTEKPGSLASILNPAPKKNHENSPTDALGFHFNKIQILQNGKWMDADYFVEGTRMQLRLPAPVKGNGQSLQIKIDYSFPLQKSSAGDRAGFMETPEGTIFEFGYWFPRMCVYDDIRGWNTLPFVGGGEFYFEYGDVDYQITAPSGMIAVGSGQLLNAKEVLDGKLFTQLQKAKQSDKTVVIRSKSDVQNGIATQKKSGMTTWHFTMKNTRDVAFALSSSFIWDGSKIDLPSGKNSFAQSVYPAQSIIADSGWTRATEFLKASVEDFSKRWFEYPYPEATNVAGPIGGMEFPALTFDHYSVSGKVLWMLISHEIGHSWYPMIVGSDERRVPFMDEGFNTFVDIYAQADFNKGEFAPKRDGEYAPGGGNPADEIVPVIKEVQQGPTLMTPPDWQDYKYVHPMSYFKTAFGLVLLREVILGPERFDYAFRHYTAKWAYKHPSPTDFFRTIENAAGEDLGWFWRGWFYNNWQLDQAVESVKYVNEDPKNGALITLENKEQLPMPVTILIKESNNKTHRVKLPVEIWQRGATWTFQVPSTSSLSTVTVDPEEQLPDTNRKNNTWKP